MEHSRRIARAVALAAPIAGLAGVVLRLACTFSAEAGWRSPLDLLARAVPMYVFLLVGAVLALWVGRRGGPVARGLGMFIGGTTCAAAMGLPDLAGLSKTTMGRDWAFLVDQFFVTGPKLFLPLVGWAPLLAGVYARAYVCSQRASRLVSAAGAMLVLFVALIGVGLMAATGFTRSFSRLCRLESGAYPFFVLYTVAYGVAASTVFFGTLGPRLRRWALQGALLAAGLHILVDLFLLLLAFGGGLCSQALLFAAMDLGEWAMGLAGACLAVVGLGDLIVQLASPDALSPVHRPAAGTLEQQLRELGAAHEAGAIAHADFEQRRRELLDQTRGSGD